MTQPTVRSVLRTVSRYRELGKQLKREPIETEFNQGSNPNIQSSSIDWAKKWADHQDRKPPVELTYLPQDRARLLSDFVRESILEHESLEAVPIEQDSGDTKTVDYSMSVGGVVRIRRQIAICDKPNQHCQLAKQIEDFLDQAVGQPIIVPHRKNGFPKGKKTQISEALTKLKTLQGLTIELSSREWQALDDALEFIRQHPNEAGFLHWRQQEKWLRQLFPPLQELIKLPAKELHESNSDPLPQTNAPPEVTAPQHLLTFPLLIGHDQNQQPVYWDPDQDQSNALNNFGFLVTGDAGSGKTQTINCLIAACCLAKFTVTIFDFKADYWQPEFVEPLGIDVYDLRTRGLPFNPLKPPPEGPSGVQPIAYTYELRDILGNVFNLGDQQRNQLQQALAGAYQEAGIPLQEWVQPDSKTWPPFTRVIARMKETHGDNNPAAMRLQQLVDLQLFPPEHGAIVNFDHFMQGRLALKLSDLPSDTIKKALAELLLVQIHGYAMRREQPKKLQHLIVFDEAHRVAENKKLELLVREGRAFGIGLVLGTQFPGDVPPSIAGNLATALYLMNNQAEHRRDVVKRVCGSTSDTAAKSLLKVVNSFKQFQGLMTNVHYERAIINLLPYFKRQASTQ